MGMTDIHNIMTFIYAGIEPSIQQLIHEPNSFMTIDEYLTSVEEKTKARARVLNGTMLPQKVDGFRDLAEHATTENTTEAHVEITTIETHAVNKIDLSDEVTTTAAVATASTVKVVDVVIDPLALVEVVEIVMIVEIVEADTLIDINRKIPPRVELLASSTTDNWVCRKYEDAFPTRSSMMPHIYGNTCTPPKPKGWSPTISIDPPVDKFPKVPTPALGSDRREDLTRRHVDDKLITPPRAISPKPKKTVRFKLPNFNRTTTSTDSACNLQQTSSASNLSISTATKKTYIDEEEKEAPPDDVPKVPPYVPYKFEEGHPPLGLERPTDVPLITAANNVLKVLVEKCKCWDGKGVVYMNEDECTRFDLIENWQNTRIGANLYPLRLEDQKLVNETLDNLAR
ncbi:hypothetical protein B0T24DRAFT_596547 [Lasiosphaeria ovina]|uniref:Uncharacterized protein n=1 Tax=Lasiosphaeria ovina TaxID=92902 RepID=A0AAE0JZ27_9PEZI|nr:hypothetical protein B0T24DRAFT_596547 [Lasiosphaeria ovina]